MNKDEALVLVEVVKCIEQLPHEPSCRFFIIGPGHCDCNHGLAVEKLENLKVD